MSSATESPLTAPYGCHPSPTPRSLCVLWAGLVLGAHSGDAGAPTALLPRGGGGRSVLFYTSLLCEPLWLCFFAPIAGSSSRNALPHYPAAIYLPSGQAALLLKFAPFPSHVSPSRGMVSLAGPRITLSIPLLRQYGSGCGIRRTPVEPNSSGSDYVTWDK